VDFDLQRRTEMTNPIKKFFQIIKSIVTFPISLLQVRKVMQDMEKFQRLPDDPEEQKKILKRLGLLEDETSILNPIFQQMIMDQASGEVDLAYLDELDEEWEEEDKSEVEEE
jgi:hypothetical protein